MDLLATWIFNFLPVLSWVAIILAGIFYLHRSEFKDLSLVLRRFGGVYAFLVLLFAVVLSVGQYLAWTNDPTGINFLPPIQPITYFLGYIWLRFLTPIFISFLVAGVWYLFLNFLRRYQDRFFENGEPELGFALALFIGWPKFLVFIPIAFLCVVLVSVFRMVFLREAYTTLGWPLVLSALLNLFYGNSLLVLFGLASLRVVSGY
jgi:hypothetical protein